MGDGNTVDYTGLDQNVIDHINLMATIPGIGFNAQVAQQMANDAKKQYGVDTSDPNTAPGQGNGQTDAAKVEANASSLAARLKAARDGQGTRDQMAQAFIDHVNATQGRQAVQVGQTKLGPAQTVRGAVIAPSMGVNGANIGPTAQINGTAIDRSQDNQMRAGQVANINTLADTAAGRGPSVAGEMLKAAQDKAIAQQNAAMGSQRGAANSALGMRAAMQGTAATTQSTAQQAYIARLQEQNQAQAQLTAALGAARGQDIGVNSQQAGMYQATNTANADAMNKTALAQATLNQDANKFTANSYDARAQAQAQLNQQANLTSASSLNAFAETQAGMNQAVRMQNANNEINNRSQADANYQYGMNQAANEQNMNTSDNLHMADQQGNLSVQQATLAQQQAQFSSNQTANIVGGIAGAVPVVGGMFASGIKNYGNMSGSASTPNVAAQNQSSGYDPQAEAAASGQDQSEGGGDYSDENLKNDQGTGAGNKGIENFMGAVNARASTGTGIINKNMETDEQAMANTAPQQPPAQPRRNSFGPSTGIVGPGMAPGGQDRMSEAPAAPAPQAPAQRFQNSFGPRPQAPMGADQTAPQGQSYAPQGQAPMGYAPRPQAPQRSLEQAAISGGGQQDFMSALNRIGAGNNNTFMHAAGTGPQVQQSQPFLQPLQQSAPQNGGVYYNPGQQGPQGTFMQAPSTYDNDRGGVPMMPKGPSATNQVVQSAPTFSATNQIAQQQAPMTSGQIAAANPGSGIVVAPPVQRLPGQVAPNPTAQLAQQAPIMSAPSTGGATNSPFAGAFGTAASAPLVSDENQKDDIKSGNSEVMNFMDAIKAHKYTYKNPAHGQGEFISPMAQELEQTDVGKQAVIDTPEGKKVNYNRMSALNLAAVANLHERLSKLEGKK